MELPLVPFMSPLIADSRLPVTSTWCCQPCGSVSSSAPRVTYEAAASRYGSNSQGPADLPAGLCSIATKDYLFFKSI